MARRLTLAPPSSRRAGLSEAALRALYALAVVRLVNGVTDPGQKGRHAAPVSALARAAGLPPLLVDVRHEVRARAQRARTFRTRMHMRSCVIAVSAR